MRRAAPIAAVLVCLTAGSAHADAGHIKVPAGWTSATDQAKSLTDKTNALKHFGGATSMASAEVYVAPAGYAAGLYVTTVVARVKDDRDGPARAEVDAFLGAPERARLTSKKIVVAASGSAVDAGSKQIEAKVAWTDADTGLSTAARMLLVGDAENLIAVTAECSHGEQPGSHVDACLAALDTLDPGLPADRRVALSLAASAPEVPVPVDSDVALQSSGGQVVAPTMSDGSRTPMPPIVVSSTPRRPVDRRPVYVGLGIIVLAALFWWNRRRREGLEATDSKDNDGR